MLVMVLWRKNMPFGNTDLIPAGDASVNAWIWRFGTRRILFIVLRMITFVQKIVVLILSHIYSLELLLYIFVPLYRGTE